MQAGMFRKLAGDALDPLPVAQGVLWHASGPAGDAMDQR
jgi:hypothetical protein